MAFGIWEWVLGGENRNIRPDVKYIRVDLDVFNQIGLGIADAQAILFVLAGDRHGIAVGVAANTVILERMGWAR